MTEKITCKICGCEDHGVTDSRPSSVYGFGGIRRRRTCVRCGFKFITLEVNEDVLHRYEEAAKELVYLRGVMRGAVGPVK